MTVPTGLAGFIFLSGFLSCGFAAQSQELWRGLSVGMTYAEVLAQDQKSTRYPTTNEMIFGRMLHNPDVPFLGHPFSAFYSFNIGQLELVTLEPKENGLTTELVWGLFDRTIRHFSETNGPPTKLDSLQDRTLTKRHRATWMLETGVVIEVRALSEPPFSFTVRIKSDPDS